MPLKKDKTTRNNAIEKALKAIKNSSNNPTAPSVRSIAQEFDIPESTLRRVIRNNGPLKRPDPNKVLTDHEEEQLVGYCLNMQRLGFGLSRSGVNHCVMEIVGRDGRPHPFNENGPGQAWWKRFLKDHSELSFHVLQALNEAYAQKANLIIINDHFNKLQKILTEYSLTPDRIWNMDETGFIIEPKLQKVIAKKGACQVHHVSYGSNHEHISVCPTISDAGTYIPPLIIYKGKWIIPGLLDSAPAGTVMGFTDTRYMQESLFRKYIEHFVNSIPPICLVLLILDGHKSHVNYTCINFCYENNILLYNLPPHTTHILQPVELPFAQLKKIYDSECDKFFTNSDKLVTKYIFAKLFGQAYIKTYTPTAICNAFKSTGIWPFNPDAISPSCLEPSMATHRFDLPSPKQPTHLLVTLTSSSLPSYVSSYLGPTSTNEELWSEIDALNKRVKHLETELELFKNPGISPLRLVLKYPLHHHSKQTADLKTDGEQPKTQQPKKKRKTMPFAQLLTNEESLRSLREAEEEAERVANEKKEKKEAAIQKQIVRETEKMQKQEMRRQKKRGKGTFEDRSTAY
ncbi:12753_t:CDS:2 [Cetraspora pellucida]|uniref:12753_t:CDS:1 n=1 Tax=Cetraspora pellucida TaxID=1433469 RepID=A0A9N9P249_9GLOM|nr:12753_t:CDS:2 [Cetraspora pellucida]